jgi:hypothetical protein
VGELATVAQESLYPQLSGALTLGPAFEGSRLRKAEAGVISGGLLLEIKTDTGGNRSGDGHYDRLPGNVLHQFGVPAVRTLGRFVD